MEALKYYEQHPLKKIITPETIIDICSKYYQVKSEDIMGERRTKEISLARQVCMYFISEILNYSRLKTAKFLNKDHATVIYGIRQIENKIKNEPEFRNEIEKLKEDITE